MPRSSASSELGRTGCWPAQARELAHFGAGLDPRKIGSTKSMQRAAQTEWINKQVARASLAGSQALDGMI